MRAALTLAILTLVCVLVSWAFGAFVEKPPLPRLVANMTGDFYGDDPEFQRRVAAAYPSPVSLDVLTKDLSDQGYILGERTAVHEERFLGCRDVWTISWQVAGEQASQIQGKFEHICP
jgi:hypothetical protein